MTSDDGGSELGRPPRRSRTLDLLADGGKSRIQLSRPKPNHASAKTPNDEILPNRELEDPEMDIEKEEEGDLESDSGSEQGRTHKPSAEHHRICEHLETTQYKEVRELYEYLEGESDHLKERGTEATFIHVLVRKLKYLQSRRNKRKWNTLKPITTKIIPWIVYRYPDLLVERSEDSSKQTAFEEASENHIQAAYCILNLLLDDETKLELKKSCCSHSENPCTMGVTHPLIDLVEKLRSTGTQDNGHAWCPHKNAKTMLDFHQNLEKFLKEAVKLNPKSTTTCLQHAIKEFRYNYDGKAVERLITISDKEMIMKKNGSDTPLISAVMQFQNPSEGDKETLKQLIQIIQLLVSVCPEALDDKSTTSGKTAYEELLLYKSEAVSEENKTQIQQVLNVLKEAVIGDLTRKHKAKLEYLYPPDFPALRICLDLGSSKPIGARFVDAVVDEIFDDFKLETVLSYVRLPPRISAYTTVSKQGQEDVLMNYKKIFDFLSDKGVKKVFKVIVNDLTDRPHTDEMIVRLVKKFNVEHWEWKKLDMSSQTILDAAPGVKSVSLHSSGSYSALQGWACKNGLIKLKNLTKVNVIVHQGVETDASLIKYKNQFEKDLRERFQSWGRTVDISPKEPELGKPIIEEIGNADHSANQALTSQNKTNHNWIQHMERFVRGLKNLKEEKSSVKVALIDDGIDPVEMKFKVVDGKSFSKDDDASEDNYYVEAGPHGTVMANLIFKMCPMVEFYMAKIVPNESSTIPPEAAVKALKWAVEEKKVDIISMSWTIKKDANQNDFEKAISTAITNNVLLFASLREAEDALVAENFYPVSLDGVFRIGSATRFGNQAESFSGDSNVAQYILPGREVLLKLGTESTEIQGSSVATALAAGLAALILHCADLADKANSQKSGTQKGKELRNKANMKKVFDRMSYMSNRKNYPEVQKYFKMQGEDLTDEDIEGTVNAVTSGLIST